MLSKKLTDRQFRRLLAILAIVAGIVSVIVSIRGTLGLAMIFYTLAAVGAGVYIGFLCYEKLYK